MDVVSELTDAVVRFGPPFLAVMAFLETAFLTGFFVPAGVALLVASFLASDGVLPLAPVVLWAVAGAFAGDATGFLLGRRLRSGARVGTTSWLDRVVSKIDPRRLAVLRRTPLYSVTLARVIAFVRTLMPISAGRSGITFVRFLAYDALGIALWAISYVAVGYLAGESWQLVSRWVGGFWAAVFGAIVVFGAWTGRKAARRGRRGDMIEVAITGNVASGKSTVARLWEEEGVPVLFADELARDAVAPGTPGLEAVRDVFGDDVIGESGELDRGAMRRRVFQDPEARRRLEAIVHPEVARRRGHWMQARRAEGAPIAAYEIPLLFETGQQGAFDVVVLVDAPESLRVERIVAHRGLEPEQARAMVDAQMPAEEKRAGSHYVIDNLGTRDELREHALRVLRAIGSTRRVGSPGTRGEG